MTLNCAMLWSPEQRAESRINILYPLYVAVAGRATPNGWKLEVGRFGTMAHGSCLVNVYGALLDMTLVEYFLRQKHMDTRCDSFSLQYKYCTRTVFLLHRSVSSTCTVLYTGLLGSTCTVLYSTVQWATSPWWVKNVRRGHTTGNTSRDDVGQAEARTRKW
jgi:hypothetical protein